MIECPFAHVNVLEQLSFVQEIFPKLDPNIIRSVGRALQKYFSEKEQQDINNSRVTPVIYQWANWKEEEKFEE